MARARNIKPGFFKNENLCELEPLDRLLFIGLWCLADREGRLENRPKKIKMELFPCDDYDVARGLQNLERAGFISVYQIAHFNVVQVLSFLVHQVPHGTEKDSELPGINGVLTVNERKDNGYITGKKSAVTVEQLLSNGVLTVKQLFLNTLNPESLILNPESGILPCAPPGAGSNNGQDSSGKKKKGKADKTAKPKVELAGIKEMLETFPTMSEKVARDYLSHRKAKNAPLTDSAWNSIAKEIMKTDLAPGDALELAMNRNWQGFESSWLQKPQRLKGGHHEQSTWCPEELRGTPDDPLFGKGDYIDAIQ